MQVRNPGRSGDGDARPDRTDEPTTETSGGAGAPAGGDDAVTRAPDETPDPPTDLPDDLLFDPLLSDEPIDLAAVRADDALIDALGGGDLDAARDLIADDDPLIAMLAAWAASARPDEPETVPGPPSLRVVGAQDPAEPEDPAPAADHPATATADAADDAPVEAPIIQAPAAEAPAAEAPAPEAPAAEAPLTNAPLAEAPLAEALVDDTSAGVAAWSPE